MPDCKVPATPDAAQHTQETDDEKLGFVHENLEGYIPALASDAEIREALEKAFDYRGDLTVTLKNGEKLEGYLFDRKNDGPTLADCYARMIPKGRPDKIRIAYSDIAALAFTGKDTAAGKSFAAWIKKYNEKKAAGETNIGIDAESLDED
jgi:uncharacterized protein YdbL (DUF1318 family)